MPQLYPDPWFYLHLITWTSLLLLMLPLVTTAMFPYLPRLSKLESPKGLTPAPRKNGLWKWH